MTTKLQEWDSGEHLQTEEDILLYLETCIEEAGSDSAFIVKSLGVVAKAKGLSKLSKDTGLSLESLYKTFSGEVIPSFDEILKISSALGLQINFQKHQPTK